MPGLLLSPMSLCPFRVLFLGCGREISFPGPCQLLLEGSHSRLLEPRIQSGPIKPVLGFTSSPISLERLYPPRWLGQGQVPETARVMISRAQMLGPLHQERSSLHDRSSLEPLTPSCRCFLHPTVLCVMGVASLQDGVDPSKDNTNNC